MSLAKLFIKGAPKAGRYLRKGAQTMRHQGMKAKGLFRGPMRGSNGVAVSAFKPAAIGAGIGGGAFLAGKGLGGIGGDIASFGEGIGQGVGGAFGGAIQGTASGASEGLQGLLLPAAIAAGGYLVFKSMQD